MKINYHCCKKMTIFCILILFTFIEILGGVAQCEQVHNPVNLALGKPYTFNIKPGYSHCSDVADSVQLTDGKAMKSTTGNAFWTTKETVGWNFRRIPIEITVDLGEVKPLSGFSLNTSAGTAGVGWPSHINVLVSEDGKKFYNVADLAELDTESFLLPIKGVCTYNYSARSLKTKGRYVKFKCMPCGIFFFCDEVEVFSGPDSNLNLELSKSEFPMDDPIRRQMTIGIKKRMLCDIYLLRNEIEKSKITAELKENIENNLDELKKKAEQYEFSGNAGQFKATVPLTAVHSEIIALFAKLLKYEGFDELNIWHKYRYSRLSMFERPSEENPKLQVRMMNGEYRSEVLNITNCEDSKVNVDISIEGLPGISSQYLKVYEVKGVDTKNSIVDFSALLPVKQTNEGNHVAEIPSGMTCQLWFLFHPQNIVPGFYEGCIKLCRANKVVQIVPLKFVVSAVRFPYKTDLKCILWDYSFPPAKSYGIRDGNMETAISMLKEYFINVPTAYGSMASMPEEKDFDKAGRLVKDLDFSLFDRWVNLWPDAAFYYIYLNKEPGKKFAGFLPGTVEFETAVGEWANSFSKHIKSKGVVPEKILLSILDEPRKPEHFQIIEKWTSAIKKSGAGFSVFENPVDLEKHDNMQYAPAGLKNVSILCPNMGYYISYSRDICDFFQKERASGKELWFYMCSQPNRLFDPAYFRLQPWQAFISGATGSGFWSFSDMGGLSSSWNPYTELTGYEYSPVYISSESITSAKQMEAIREGIEDYQYLVLLKNAEDKSSSSAHEMALDVIKNANELKGKTYWTTWDTNNSPCAFADSARNMILDKLERKK